MIKVTSLTINCTDRVINLTISPYLDLSNYYTKAEVDALVADLVHEIITFTNADGVVIIDMSINDRQEKFTRPSIEAFVSVGTNDTKINGFSEVLSRDVDDNIETITLDGIFGTGYINISNN